MLHLNGRIVLVPLLQLNAKNMYVVELK